jgi:tetratricopeptide (TPR) repeat protein
MDSQELVTTTKSSPPISETKWRENGRGRRIAICVFLALIVALAFGRSLGHDFVNYDDTDYVYENPRITAGISFGGIIWAFTHVHAANWHPLTTISHMLDCQLYGLHPWGHHLTNVLLHAVAAILLFLALCTFTASFNSTSHLSAVASAKEEQLNPASPARTSTSSFWASAFVAALFAVHPLRVESVAWISERKDVLSGVFFMLTLLAYARYARGCSQGALPPCSNAAPRQSGADRTTRYLTVVVFFVLGLLSKPTLVTLPFVLLLLDYWPLGRMRSGKGEARSDKGEEDSGKSQTEFQRFSVSVFRSLVVEKIPLFVLSAASCVATVLAQQKVIEANLRVTFLERASNALISYVAYLGEMIWPLHLVVSHPYAEKYQNLPQAIASLVLLLIVSTLCFLVRRKYPFLLTGWLWYIGMLVPMIGFVQVSAQARADRYTYLPQIGIYLMLVWSGATLIQRFRVKRVFVAAPAAVVVVVLVCCSYAQAHYWHDTETLWRHALDSSTYDYIAHDSLGYTLVEKGNIDEAITEYRKAIDIKPNYAEAHNNLANALLQKGLVDEATAHYQRALELDPEFAEPHNNLGNVLFKEGRVDEAIEQYKIAVAKRPEFAEVHCNLGSAYIVKGDWDDAIPQLRTAVKIDPKYAQAHNKLGIALAASGGTDEAVAHFKEAVRLDPNYAEAHFNLGYVLAHTGRRREAIEHYLKAVHLRPDYPEAKQELRQLGLPVAR